MKKLTTVFVVLLLAAAAHTGEWHIETADSGVGVGWYNSLALDSSGYPHISYFDNNSDVLKYAWLDGVNWHIEALDSMGDMGGWTSIALDNYDYPHISYREYNEGYLNYIYWDGEEWHIENLSSGACGWSSLALDSNSYPHFSYTWGGTDLKYIYWNGEEWYNETVDTSRHCYDLYPSLALDSNDFPHITYYCNKESWQDLKYARWDGVSWHIETVDTYLDGRFTSMVLDSNDYTHITYLSRYTNIKYAHWDGFEWLIEDFTYAYYGVKSSIYLDSSDRPNIAYSHNNVLLYARWDGESWQIESVDSDSASPSLILDASDNPHISYRKISSSDLKYAYWDPGSGVEGVELSAVSSDEGVLLGWTITGDIPAALRVLRSAGDDSPATVSGDLDGAAVRWLDRNIIPGNSYTYWLETVEADGKVSRFGPTEAVTVPEKATTLALDAAHPSPAREVVNLAYSLPADGRVALLVYDLSGRRVATLVDSEQAAGRHEVAWSCAVIPSGVYLYRLETSAGSLTRRLVVSR